MFSNIVLFYLSDCTELVRISFTPNLKSYLKTISYSNSAQLFLKNLTYFIHSFFSSVTKPHTLFIYNGAINQATTVELSGNLFDKCYNWNHLFDFLLFFDFFAFFELPSSILSDFLALAVLELPPSILSDFLALAFLELPSSIFSIFLTLAFFGFLAFFVDVVEAIVFCEVCEVFDALIFTFDSVFDTAGSFYGF